MTDKQPTEMTLDELIVAVSSALYSKSSAVFIAVIEDPSHDSAVGKVKFVRRGEGPAYNLMMYNLEYELDLAREGADEVEGEDELGEDD